MANHIRPKTLQNNLFIWCSFTFALKLSQIWNISCKKSDYLGVPAWPVKTMVTILEPVQTLRLTDRLGPWPLQTLLSNPLDPRRGNFDSSRGWVCFRTHFPIRPGIWLVDLRVPRLSRPGVWWLDSGPSSVIGWFEGAKNKKLAVKLHSLDQY